MRLSHISRPDTFSTIAITIGFLILIVMDFTQGSKYKMPNIVDHISSYIAAVFFFYLFWRSRRKRGEKAQKVEGLLEKSDIKEELRKGAKKAWVIWSVMFGSFAIYVIVCLLTSAKNNFNIGANFNFVRIVLYAISAVELVFVYYVRKVMLRDRSGRQGSMIERHTSGLKPALIKYNRALIVTLSMAVLIGVNGIILYFMSRDFRSLLIFVIISWIIMVIYRPNGKEIEELAIEAENKKNKDQSDGKDRIRGCT